MESPCHLIPNFLLVSLIVTLAVSATVFEIFRLKDRCRDEIWHQKTRIMGLPDSEEIMMLAFFVLHNTGA